MKKSGILLLLAAVTLVFSCQKEKFNGVLSGEDSVISAVIDGENTKTTLDGVKICWISGDEIAVNKAKYVATPDAADARKATFTLTSSNPMVPAKAPTDAPFCAYYPFDANKTTAKGEFILPSTQNYSTSNPLGLVNPMYAVSESLESTFHFKNVCGLITLDLKGEGTVKDITISANEYLAGKLTGVAISDKDELTYNAIEDDGYYASKSVSLGCGTKATLDKETARRFYIALPEGDFTGVKLTVTTDQAKVELPAKKTVSIKKNNIYHLPEMTVSTPPITFSFAQTALTHNSITYEVTPSLNTAYYYTEVLKKEDIEDFGNVETYAAALLSFYLENYEPAAIIKGLMNQGPSTQQFYLDPKTDYSIIAFAVDNQCNIISDVATEAFTSLELPYVEAGYEDYLGKWIAGGHTITVSKKVEGSTYNIEGLTYTSMGNTSAPVEAVYNSTAKCLTLSEQFIGTYNHPSFGECNEYLCGIFCDEEGSYVAYPFNTDEMEVILTAWKTKEGDIVWEAGKCIYGIFSNIGTSTVIQTGVYKGDGFKGVGISLPQTLEEAPDADESYLKWIGTWQTEGGRTIKIEEAVANQTFIGTFDNDLSGAIITIPYSDGKIQLNSQFLEYGNSSYGKVAIFLCGCMWDDEYNDWSPIPDEYPICTVELKNGGNSFSFSKGTYMDSYMGSLEIGAITYGALIVEGEYKGYSLGYSDVTPIELPATFTKVQPTTSDRKAFTGNSVLGHRSITNNYVKFNISNNREYFAPAFDKKGSKIKKVSVKDIRF